MKEDKDSCVLCVNTSTANEFPNVDNAPAYNDLIECRKREIEEILRSFLPDSPELIEDLWENFDIKVIKQ